MNIIVFTKKPPTLRQSKLISQLIDLGLDPMVDAVHTWKDWFLEQFVGNHRVFYTDPFLLTGKITDVDFGISGIPDFIIYTNTNEPCSDEDWMDITNWLDASFRGEEAKPCKLKPATRPTLLQGIPEFEQDPLVKRLDARQHYYSFEYKHLADLDICLYSVHKPFEDTPFTVIVDHYSKYGHLHFFTDIFNNPEWGRDVLNLNFLIKVWEELKMEGVLDGDRLDQMLEKRTKEFLPKEGICLLEPQVYRKSIEELLQEKASFGIKV